MRMFSRLAFSTILMGSLTLPVVAQTPSAGNATTAPATHDTTKPASTPPVARITSPKESST